MRVRRGLWCASVVLVSSGCGLIYTQADAPASTSASSSAPAHSAASTRAASPTTASAAADLTGSADGRAARLAVTTGPVAQGAPPVDACTLSGDGNEYETLTVVFTVPDAPTKGTGTSSNLRLDLSVPDGAGVFAESVNPTTDCSGALPAQTTLQTQNLAEQHQTVKVYVVGPAGTLPGVTLKLTNPRHRADNIDGRAWTWTVSAVTAGTACDGDPNSLCVPLG